MFKRFLSILCTLLFMLVSCADSGSTNGNSTQSQKSTEVFSSSLSYPLAPSEDMGQEYIDSFIFLGESTTYHLKNRGVLSGGTGTHQVWGPKSGTLMLDTSTASCRIVYPDSGEEIDISEAMRRKKPSYILLTFGLNGTTKSISKGSEYFKGCYKKLISTLQAASPESIVILQSCFPVAKSMDVSNYSVSVSTLNGYIDTLNKWSMELSEELSIGYLNSAEILKNDEGYLFEEYQAGDGYHLSKGAYLKILEYIRTHAYPKEKIK